MDNSILSALFKIGKFSILHCVFQNAEIIISEAVYLEFVQGHGKVELDDFSILPMISDYAPVLKNHENFDKFGDGEKEAIQLAIVREDLLISDDKSVIGLREDLEIDIIGTVGVLIQAYDKGCFVSNKEYLQVIEAIIQDLRLSKSLISLLLSKVTS